jgi:hypothetical protein
MSISTCAKHLYNFKANNSQGGLSAILGPNPSPSQIHDLTLRAQCYYLSRKKKVPIDFNEYKAYLATKPSKMDTQPSTESTAVEQPVRSKAPEPEPTSNSTTITNTEATTQPASTLHLHHEADLPNPEKGAPYPPTFAEIVELITSGKPIPGIKDIPPTLLTSQATKPTASKRRKPWDKELPSEEGMFGDRRDEIIVQELPEE